jgi:hypothetical protein
MCSKSQARTDKNISATISKAQVVSYIETQAKLNPDTNWSAQDFFTVVGEKESYTPAEVKSYRPGEKTPGPGEPAKKLPGVPRIPPMGAASPRFQGVKIRASYTDALLSEDPTLAKNPGKVSDLTGALFSYSRDFIGESDSWVAKGAVLLPFSASNEVNGVNLQLQKYGVIPSVSFDREFNGNDPKKNVDSLIFRVGAFVGLAGVGPFDSLTLRLFGTYGTDFEFKSEIPAGEFELEPTYSDSRVFGLGRIVRLIPFGRVSDPAKEKTILAYQLRLLLHGQYGDVVDAGKIGIPARDFFRLGPKLQLRLDPLFLKQLICTVGYEYLANASGFTKNHDQLTIAPEFVLNKPNDDATTLDAPLISLKATYQEGSLDLTTQRVQTFLVGLGIIY